MQMLSKKFLLIILSLMTEILSLAQPIPNDSLYLGQVLPGNTPKIFNLPVTNVMRPCERIAITTDGKEIYYAEINTYPPTNLRVKYYKYENNSWQGPNNVFEGFMAPKLSPDDSIIYLQDNSFHTYYSKRLSTGWSVPRRLIFQDFKSHYLQKTTANNYYASSYNESSSNGDICYLIMRNGDTVLQSLGTPINSSYQENDFLISANESYLIVSRTPFNGAADMYLSFKKENGKWTNPKKLEEPISKPGYNWEYGQFVSSDGKYLFFTSGGLSWQSYYTYWVKIDNIIDSLKHTNFIPYVYSQIPDQSVSLGKQFTFTIPDSTFIDDDGNNTLTYSASLSDGAPLPSWLTFDAVSRIFSGIPDSANNIIVKVAATDSANVSVVCTFSINITIAGIEKNTGKLPSEFKLYQNYPNPFNPTTTIEFAIIKNGRYKLSLYNSLGELVKEIADKEFKSGHYSETFNASGMPSGVYIYQLKGDEAEIERKMVVLK